MPRSILLTNWHAPGDTVCMTACVRDLVSAWPQRYDVYIGGACSDIWRHNPHIAGFVGARFPRGIPTFRMSYLPQLRESGEVKLHFLTAFHRLLEEHLDHPVPVLQPKGDLHLCSKERSDPPIQGAYWVLVAGGTRKIETKIWSFARFQQVVDLLWARGIRIVQIGAKYPGHCHANLDRVLNLVGKTSLRDVLQLIWHASGVISPVTFAMHVAAALDKPCVVLAGGREPWWWEAYVDSGIRHFGSNATPVCVPHRYLHAQGLLDCCRFGGCWKSKITATGRKPTKFCVSTVDDQHGQAIPDCLDLITAETVVEAVLGYYRDETIPEEREGPFK